MKKIFLISLFLIYSCVSIDEKRAMVAAKALSDLKCLDDTIVSDLGKDRFAAQCKSINRGKAYYQVKCGKVPKSCRVLRFRR